MSVEDINVKRVYDAIANHFDVTRYSVWIDVRKFIDSLDKNSFVLDAGCGNGKNMYREDCYFIGGDFCNKFLEITKSKKIENGYDVVQFNTKQIPLKDNMFDYTISVAVIHHISSQEQRIKSIEELIRVTKPGGKIFISVWGAHKNYNVGDNYIKWELQSKYNSSIDNKMYYRYYYLYNDHELLNDITENISNVIVIKHYSNFNNRFIILCKN
jgi:tRNA (uracil-5-)-methyltransferase TRM9